MSKKLVCSYLQDIAKRLWEPRKYGYASVMVGAGFSKNAKSLTGDVKMPDWMNLLLIFMNNYISSMNHYQLMT